MNGKHPIAFINDGIRTVMSSKNVSATQNICMLKIIT